MTDVCFRKFVNGNVRVIIIEDAFYEHQNRASKWASKYDQVKSYCGQTHTEAPNNTQPLFVVVTVGKASSSSPTHMASRSSSASILSTRPLN